jgi:hypothetical protein
MAKVIKRNPATGKRYRRNGKLLRTESGDASNCCCQCSCLSTYEVTPTCDSGTTPDQVRVSISSSSVCKLFNGEYINASGDESWNASQTVTGGVGYAQYDAVFVSNIWVSRYTNSDCSGLIADELWDRYTYVTRTGGGWACEVVAAPPGSGGVGAVVWYGTGPSDTDCCVAKTLTAGTGYNGSGTITPCPV